MSRSYVEKLIKNLENMDCIAIISICSNQRGLFFTESNLSIVSLKGCSKILNVFFDDITDKDLGKMGGHILFDRLIACQIISFIDTLKAAYINTLLIHCDAGISRSGAVGVFACRYLGLNEDKFRSLNTNIQPNQYVYDLLYQESGMKKAYENFWLNKKGVRTVEISEKLC